MTHAGYYPRANVTAQWFGNTYPGVGFNRIEKLVLHTTEGTGWPAYSGGSKAPHLTCMPDAANRRLVWRQHFRLDRSSRALRHTQSTDTNNDHAIQIEMIGTCISSHVGMYWPEAPDWALQGIADFAAFLHAEWGLKLQSHVTWRSATASGDWQRLSNSTWNSYLGILGHEHVPQNTHRDPGAFPIDRLLSMIAGNEDDMPISPNDAELILNTFLNYVPPGQSEGLNLKTLWKRAYEQAAYNTRALLQLDPAALAKDIADALPALDSIPIESMTDAVAKALAKRLDPDT